MGASNSKYKAFIQEQEEIEAILNKPTDSMTEKEKDKLRKYIEKYDQIVTRFIAVLEKIDLLLDGGKVKDPVKDEAEWSEEDTAEIKITEVITKLKRKMNMFIAASEHFKQLAKENYDNKELLKEYLLTMGNLKKNASEMEQYLASMEEKKKDLHTAKVTLEHVVLLDEVATSLENMQETMDTVEEYEANLANLEEARYSMNEIHATVQQSIEDPNIDDLMREMDAEMAEERIRAELPEVPTTIPTVAEVTEEEVEERVAEME